MYNVIIKSKKELELMPTDLQKKDELRRELRLLTRVQAELERLLGDSAGENIALSLITERVIDIQKALED